MRRILRNIWINLFFLLLSIYYEITFIMNNKPLAYSTTLNGDQLFHINRLHGLSKVFTSPIVFDNYHQVGNGVNYFYPWLTFYPAELLSKLLHSEARGIIVFLVIVTYLTFSVAYYSCKIYLNWNVKKSILFSFLWTFSSYRGVNFFNRTDIGELLATIFIPLVLMSFISLLKDKKYKNWIVLAIGMSLIMLSHILSTLIMIIVFLLVMIMNSNYLKDIKIWVSLIISAVETSLMTMMYWLPMIQQQKYIGISRPAKVILYDWALDMGNLINRSFNNNYLLPNLGIMAIMVILLGIIKFNKLKNIDKLIMAQSLIFLWLCTKYFPWQLLQETFFNYIQFPWRFIIVVTLFTSILGAKWISKLNSKYIFILIVAICISHYAFVLGLPEKNALKINSDQSIENICKEYTNQDYYPKAATNNSKSIENKEFIFNSKNVSIANQEIKATEYSFTVLNNNTHKVTVDVPILYYLGIRADSNNKLISTNVSKRGTVSIDVEKGKSKITVYSEYTRLAKLSQKISLISSILILIIGIVNFYRKRYIRLE